MKWRGPNWAKWILIKIGWLVLPPILEGQTQLLNPRIKFNKPSKKKIKAGKLPHCIQTDKTMYPEALAKMEAERLAKKTVDGYLRAYKCQFCESWHLTHHKPHRT